MKCIHIALLSFISISTAISADIEATTADGKKAILKEDGTWRYKGEATKTEEDYQVKYGKDYFLARDGYDKQVRVKFKHSENLEKLLPTEQLVKMVENAVIDSKYKAKNKLSFVPFSVSIIRFDVKSMLDKIPEIRARDGAIAAAEATISISEITDGQTVITVEWLSKNDYGAESKETSYSGFDSSFKIMEK